MFFNKNKKMKRLSVLIFVILASANLFAQVGIGTTDPQSTLDINGSPSIASAVDGLLPPRLLRSELSAKTGYGAHQAGIIIYVSDLSGATNTQTRNVTEVGFYFFNGNMWGKMGSNNSSGDIKSGIQLTDHDGWIRLDGRAKATLTVTQQVQATALGIGPLLPNANNAYLSQNGAALGSVSGSNNRSIARNQLPLFTLGGSTNTEGDHADLDIIGSYDAGSNTDPNINVNDWAVIRSEGTIGDHDHSITTDNLNNTGSQQTLDITPVSLSVNRFIYLGN
jgi:hypothetical protein